LTLCDLSGEKPLLLRLLVQAAAEALDLATRVNQTLFTREERVAPRAQIDPKVCLGGLSLPGVAASAVNRRFDVVWMNARLHFAASIWLAG
jgi:hypothetical protein